MKTSEPKRGRPPLPEGEAATGHIHLRVKMPRKNAYVRAAYPRPLAEWMFSVCDKAAGYSPRRFSP